MDTKALNAYKTRIEDNFYPQDELVFRRQNADIYPRIAFAEKVVIIGTTAPSPAPRVQEPLTD